MHRGVKAKPSTQTKVSKRWRKSFSHTHLLTVFERVFSKGCNCAHRGKFLLLVNQYTVDLPMKGDLLSKHLEHHGSSSVVTSRLWRNVSIFVSMMSSCRE